MCLFFAFLCAITGSYGWAFFWVLMHLALRDD